MEMGERRNRDVGERDEMRETKKRKIQGRILGRAGSVGTHLQSQ
jgi:hypothetical protein